MTEAHGDLSGRCAAITGAGSGIGRATALRFAAEGATVFALDIDGDAAAATVAEIGAGATAAEIGAGATAAESGAATAAAADAKVGGQAAFSARLDVADEGAVAAVFAQVRDTFGREPDILANIAGIGSTTNVPDTSLETWERVFAVDARGIFLCCRAVLPGMVARGSGTIVNMASIAGLVGLRNRAAYCAAKGAVIALTRAMAVDHVGDGLRINCVAPGTVDSPWVARLLAEAGEDRGALEARQPMARLGTPEEIADAVTYLASDRSTFATGSVLVVDGGLTAQ